MECLCPPKSLLDPLAPYFTVAEQSKSLRIMDGKVGAMVTAEVAQPILTDEIN